MSQADLHPKSPACVAPLALLGGWSALPLDSLLLHCWRHSSPRAPGRLCGQQWARRRADLGLAQFLGETVPPILAPQVHEATGGAYSSGSAGGAHFAELRGLVAVSSAPFCHRFTEVPVVSDQSEGSQEAAHSVGEPDVHPGLPSAPGGPGARASAQLVPYCWGAGSGDSTCGLLSPPTLPWSRWCQVGLLLPHPHPRILSAASCP